MKEDHNNEELIDEDGDPTDEEPEYGSINEWLDDMEKLNYSDGRDKD